MHGRFVYIKYNSTRKGKEWNLTEEEYTNLVNQNCKYCGMKNDTEAGVGLDRLDNSKGYLKDNVVSCCIDCNYVRGNRFSPEEMKLIGEVIREIKFSRERRRSE